MKALFGRTVSVLQGSGCRLLCCPFTQQRLVLPCAGENTLNTVNWTAQGAFAKNSNTSIFFNLPKATEEVLILPFYR